MKAKKTRWLAVVAVCCVVVTGLLWSGCTARKRALPTPRKFYRDILLPTTPVKNQGSTALCWVYAMLSTIETEHLVGGDSVNLSADYVARKYLEEQAETRFLKGFPYGDDSDYGLTLRGMAPMLIHLIETYGLVHYDAYPHREQANGNVLLRKLQQQVDGAFSLPAMRRDVARTLDEAMGVEPRSLFMYGVRYTPIEFAHSVCKDREWVAMTSFSHHPYYKRCVLELPDNRFHDAFLNVPIDTLMAKVEQSVRAGHPVCWEGDISEPRFRWDAGYAQLPDETAEVTQEARQEAFEHKLTTDDHCMSIVGLAHDGEGRRYFIMKNSWGRTNALGGFIYVSFPYVRMKTIAVMVKQ